MAVEGIKIILLHSNMPSIGKSTYARHLTTVIPNSIRIPFTAPIKTDAHELYNNMIGELNLPTITYDQFAESQKNVILPIESGYTPRDITIKYSDFIQDIFGISVWGKMAVNTIHLSSRITNNRTFIFDDWRRPVESEQIINAFGIQNVVKVYLSKIDVTQTGLNAIGNTYEGLIKPEDCNIKFEFNSDWSNTEELTKVIKENLDV